MRSAKVVIGSALGDEGKGLMVDKYAAEGRSPIVVRFSGGANAGHTVVAPNGKRHVFAHFGAGSLANAATHLSRFFIVNPFLWVAEATELQALGAWSKTTIDPKAMMSTPFDMLINQFVEESRGEDRHGSVGVGINETVHRCSNPLWHTPAAYAGMHFLKKTLVDIREGYVFQRLNDLRITPTTKQTEILMSDAMLDDFVEAARKMRLYTSFADAEILLQHDTIIFEGSQGLLLDEKHRFFPHVTRARTGLTNVVTLASELNLDELDVTYVTRAYTTRHGAGPLPNCDANLRYADETNQPNAWQGSMRFAPLNMHLLGEAVLGDLARSKWKNLTASLCITHLDQVDQDRATFVASPGNPKETGPWEHLVRYAQVVTAVDNTMVSFGPTREHVGSFDSAQRKIA